MFLANKCRKFKHLPDAIPYPRAMKRPKTTLFPVVLFLLLLCWASVAAEAPVHPNILWIVADDLGAELGCYGTPLMRTPNLDKLASQGARFTRCFTTAPVCSPAAPR